MLVQPSSIGALFGVAVGIIFFIYICGWHEKIKRLIHEKPAISNKVNLSLATITFISTTFLFSGIFDILSYLWINSSEISNKVAIIRAISSFILSVTIGFATIYVARQQHILAKNNASQEDIRRIYNRGDKQLQDTKKLQIKIIIKK